ncbi:MAG: Hsp20/alpha crystallin family protein [bacterium]
MKFEKPVGSHLRDFLIEDGFWDWAEGRSQWMPAVDVEESEGNYILRAEVPGLKKEDIKISLTDKGLTLSGEKKAEAGSEGRTVHRTERRFGAFRRTYTLAEPIQADKITAHYKDGILEVTVPKAQKEQAREIEIQVL